MVQFFDIIEKPLTRNYGETLQEWKERMLLEYIPKFKELALFNDSMGSTTMPLALACERNNLSIDDFCKGYVFECFEGIDEETFELMDEV